MDKSQCLNIFNQKLREFVNDLIVVFPSDTDLYSFKTSLNMIGLVNERQMIDLFVRFVHKTYRTQILNRDESFFLTHTYSDEISHTEDNNVTTQLIAKIKTYWADMSHGNKDIVWKYFEVLIRLTEKYISLK